MNVSFRRSPDPQRAAPRIICSCCGAQLYDGESYWQCNGLRFCEDCLAELKGHLAMGDIEGAEVTKSRLIRFLEHLRRLVGFNIDNII